MKKKTFNRAYFKKIDTEEKAYWAGFIHADGHVTKQKLSIHLADKDIDHLHKLKCALSSEHNVYHYKSSCELTIYDSCFYKCFENVSICESFLKHYWRGVFDGDGCIYQKTTGKNFVSITLVGDKETVESFLKYIKKFIKTETKIYFQGGIWRVTLGGTTKPRQALEVMYGEGSVYLERKYQQYCNIVSMPVKFDISGTSSLKESAKIFEITPMGVLKRIRSNKIHGAIKVGDEWRIPNTELL